MNSPLLQQPNPPLMPTVLGQTPSRIPTAGKIRAGVKVLTRKAAEYLLARDIYEKGLNAGDTFDAIEKRITEQVPELKTPLVPKNVPWFTVRPQDFAHPELAQDILNLYGETREDGVKRLYRFPVVFPSDTWQVVMPHELAVWGASEKRFWSEYDAEGSARFCKTYAPVPKDASSKRAIRPFGGRKTILRPDTQGVCDPECCKEYQNRQCNLSGRFLFFIPGIRSLSAFELHTHSFYAMNAAIQTFKTIAFLRGGRISGFLDRQRTSFFLTKILKEIVHIDDTGQALRVPQWLIDLQAPVDVTALLRDAEDEEGALVQANLATHILEGRSRQQPAPASSHHESDTSQPTVLDANTIPHTSTVKEISPSTTSGALRGPSVETVFACAEEYGIDRGRYEHYADQRWGTGWKLNAGGRQRAFDELERYRNDPDGYLDKIETELSSSL